MNSIKQKIKKVIKLPNGMKRKFVELRRQIEIKSNWLSMEMENE